MAQERQFLKEQTNKDSQLVNNSVSEQLINNLQRSILDNIDDCKMKYTINNIPINQSQTLHTIYIKGKQGCPNKNIYLGHGFGASSMLYFHSFQQLLKKGNLIIWQVRGMGLTSNKPLQYKINNNAINKFYTDGFARILQYYDHKNIILINHSLSSYIVFRYLLNNDNKNIEKLVSLSAVGVTPKQKDPKNSVKSIKDIWQMGLAKFGWKFNLTYKSPLRTVLSYWKTGLLRRSFSQYFTGKNLQHMTALFQTLIKLNDGSQNLFFKYFYPRVLPRQGQSIVELLGERTFKYDMSFYFGEKDWADRSGVQAMMKNNKNIRMEILGGCDHMIPFSMASMQRIIQQQL